MTDSTDFVVDVGPYLVLYRESSENSQTVCGLKAALRAAAYRERQP